MATDDLFYAEFDETEAKFMHKKTIQNSGNSIVQIAILEKGFDATVIRDQLKAINCLSEALNETFFAAEIGKDVDYALVRSLLSEYESQEIIEFAEPCLSEKHRTDLLKN
ncbi:DUF4265 domain-containing protein [Flavobacterium johnsoniae]|uniref:DUF4265 domain-containing protein n=1 Tax=Flavobacterium johnsoniae TaxID=986 RepID=UPI0025B1D986|nr:DUF4265 domain-containing protein [Flavobacterium johnsoniae]WJS97111.1 DUF4265 domain-containing protein [Flavobacterium johnsoniae]